MNHRLFVALVGTASLVSVVSAQDSDRPPIDLFQVIRDTPWTVTVSARHFSSNAETVFSGIGSTQTDFDPGVATGTNVTRTYFDGGVGVDPTGNSGSQSRLWSVNNVSAQVAADGKVAFHDYYVTAPGGFSVEADSDASLGVDLAVTRRIWRLGRRWELGLTFGMGLTDVNMKEQRQDTVTLGRLTDTYQLTGTLPANRTSYSAPDFLPFTVIGPNGSSYTAYQDITVPIGAAPISRVDVADYKTTTLFGFWQLRGAYYFLRMGPTLRAKITDRLQVAVGAGGALGFLGTKFRFDELIDLTAGTAGTDATPSFQEQGETTKDEFIPGYYGEAQVEYFLSQKTGFFVGASYEKLGEYSQSVGNRTAKVELGKGVGFKLGIVTRF